MNNVCCHVVIGKDIVTVFVNAALGRTHLSWLHIILRVILITILSISYFQLRKCVLFLIEGGVASSAMSTSVEERENYVPWTKDNSDVVEEGSATESLRECISFAGTPEVLPPTYVNHFAAFFSLATNIALPGSLLQSLHQDISAASEELSVPATPYAQGNQPESLPWLTVIKDGKDARKDNKQQDLEREATAKELEFS